jgi:hypothetical protein
LRRVHVHFRFPISQLMVSFVPVLGPICYEAQRREHREQGADGHPSNIARVTYVEQAYSNLDDNAHKSGLEIGMFCGVRRYTPANTHTL